MVSASSEMYNPFGLPSRFLGDQNITEEEFDEVVLAQPKSMASVSTRLAENPGICIDAPFSTASQNYVWKSHPSVLDPSVNRSVNGYAFSHMQRQEFLPGKGWATPNGRNILGSTDSLVNFSTFGVSTGQSSKKRGATTDNGIHKLIERQRRNDMKWLFSTLASLLPKENLEGKRSVADQVLEAIHYIKHLQTKVKELAKRRDEMMKISDNSIGISFTSHSEEKICRFLPFHIGSEVFPSLRVNPFGSGLEVIANTFKNRIVFSHLLQILEQEGLEVVAAGASAVDDKVFYTIHSKIPDIHNFESTALYQKLWHLIGESMQHA